MIWRAALFSIWTCALLTLASAGDEGRPSPTPAPSPTPTPTAKPGPLDPVEAYSRAVALINRRQVKAYPEAKRLFASVPKGHELYPDAQAYLEWVEADLLVREATKDFRGGEVARALGKLDRARKFKVLGPRAKESVDQRRAAWTRAVTACRKGIDYVTRGKLLQAKMQLRPVAEGRLKGAVRAVAKAYLALAEEKVKEVPARERELGRKLNRLDPKLLLPPKKPVANKKKPSKKADAKKGGKSDDGWSDSEWSDWDDGKSKSPSPKPGSPKR